MLNCIFCLHIAIIIGAEWREGGRASSAFGLGRKSKFYYITFSKLGQFLFSLLCLCLSEEMLKATSLFSLLLMPVKIKTQEKEKPSKLHLFLCPSHRLIEPMVCTYKYPCGLCIGCYQNTCSNDGLSTMSSFLVDMGAVYNHIYCCRKCHDSRKMLRC